jgi:hypothetical protein
MVPTTVSSREVVIAEAQVIGPAAVPELAAESLAIGQAAELAQVIDRVAALVQVIDRVVALELAAGSLAIGQVAEPALAIDRVAVLVQVIVLAAAQARGIVRAAVPGLEIALELGVDLQTERPRAHLAGPAETKLVTAPHPRGPVPLLAVEEDLAAAAETTREPAATEAAAVWVAVATAAAVAAEG